LAILLVKARTCRQAGSAARDRRAMLRARSAWQDESNACPFSSNWMRSWSRSNRSRILGAVLDEQALIMRLTSTGLRFLRRSVIRVSSS
jgi:hypothetical protein